MIENPLIHALVLSILPVSELRGGIPYAVASGVHPLVAYIGCVLANLLVIPLEYAFLSTLHKVLYRVKLYRTIFDWFVVRTKRKAEKQIRRYGYWGVMLFVAIPLPVTGAYTGAFAAWLLELDRMRAFWYLALGVAIAGIIVSIATLTGLEILQFFTK